MGSTQSFYAGTPLGCMLDNWKAFRRQADYGVVLNKDDLIKFCTIEWPTFGVGWPDGGTLKLNTVQAVHGIVTRDGHWDQYPYIDIWQDLVANSPPWLQTCRQKMTQMLMARVPIKRPSTPVKKPCPPPVIPQSPDYVLSSPLAPPLYPNLSDLESSSGTNGEVSPLHGLIKKTSPHEIAIQTQPDPPTDGGVYQSTRGALKLAGTHDVMMPLGETIGQEGERTVVYVPFTTSDLYNWKQQNPPFSENPAPLTAIFEISITAHNPTWGDMQVVLTVLLTPDERRMVLAKALEWVTQTYPQDPVPTVLPGQDPGWTYKDEGLHQRYATAIVQGMKRCIRKTPNWAKLYNIRQERQENPAAFYEWLCETCRRYTDLNPEDQNGKRVLIPLFIGQSYDDIRRKLQKVEGASGKNIEELLEIALKVYDRRDEEERKKGARALAMALRTGSKEDEKWRRRSEGVDLEDKGKPRGPCLGRNQCALCRQEGHWKNEFLAAS
uniref:Core shell protein Gag P30 domain-containing protein n=1 Tax=Chelonoidis abingdonii TaxID=106734 RepID=A0A8C0J3G8_CHEAB